MIVEGDRAECSVPSFFDFYNGDAMLRELVELIAAASETVGRGESVNHLQDCIDRAVGAVGKSDIEKRKMDEAICLLFRATHEMQSNKDEAYDMVKRAEILLGYAPLTPVTTG